MMFNVAPMTDEFSKNITFNKKTNTLSWKKFKYFTKLKLKKKYYEMISFIFFFHFINKILLNNIM